MTSPAERELTTLIDRLHGRERLRVWSIVITVYGDAVAPRGGTIGLGALQALIGAPEAAAERQQIDPDRQGEGAQASQDVVRHGRSRSGYRPRQRAPRLSICRIVALKYSS